MPGQSCDVLFLEADEWYILNFVSVIHCQLRYSCGNWSQAFHFMPIIYIAHILSIICVHFLNLKLKKIGKSR